MNINDYVYLIHIKSPKKKCFEFSIHSEKQLEECAKSIALHLKKLENSEEKVFFDHNNKIIFRLDPTIVGVTTLTLNEQENVIGFTLNLIDRIKRNYDSIG